MKKQILLWGVVFLCIIGCSIYCVFYTDYSWISSIISVIGAAASFIGILVTLKQVDSAVEKTEEVHKAVSKNSKELKEFHSYSSFSLESEKVNSLISDLRNKEYNSMHRRLAELKSFLIKQRSNPQIIGNSDWKSQLDSLVQVLGIDCKNILTKINNRKNSIDLDSVAHHLMQVSLLLNSVCGKIENDRYGN